MTQARKGEAMEKISQNDARALLKTAGSTIRTLTGEVRNLREKIASFERENRIRSIAQEMEQKQLASDMSYEEKVASLRQARDLNVTAEAVKLASPQGFTLGRVSDTPSLGDAESALTTFIMTGDSPE
jgi:hypothetical protein